MANLQQAPVLKFNGAKTQDNTTNQSYQIPQHLADIIFKELGNSSAQLRIMMVLCGTKEGFAISEKWILERTGLQHASYINARKALVAKGWLVHEESKGITINFNVIYGKCSNTTLPLENEKSRGNTTLPHRGNTILPHRGNTTLPIIDNIIDNKINNVEVAPEVEEVESPKAEEVEEKGNSITNPIPVDKEWLAERYNDLIHYGTAGVYKYNNKFYKMQ